VSGFDQVVFEGLGEITIRQGDHEALTITAESNVMKRITSIVRGHALHIGYRGSVFGLHVVPTMPIRYELTVRNIDGLDLTGLGSIFVGAIAADSLSVDLSGAGRVVLRALSADRLDVNLSGLGSCQVAGQVQRQELLLTGGGNYDATDLASDRAVLTLTGLGKATVWATEELDVTITGAGGVAYYGSPRVTQDVTGLGRVRSLVER